MKIVSGMRGLVSWVACCVLMGFCLVPINAEAANGRSDVCFQTMLCSETGPGVHTASIDRASAEANCAVNISANPNETITCCFNGEAYRQSISRTANYTIYVGPQGGNDPTRGDSTNPIKTLQYAQTLIEKMFITDQKKLGPVRISVAPGNYYGQATVWGVFLKNFSISVEGQVSGHSGPVFIGVNEQFKGATFGGFDPALVTSGASIFLDLPNYMGNRNPQLIYEDDTGKNVMRPAFSTSSPSQDLSNLPSLNFTVKSLRIAHYCEGISLNLSIDRRYSGVQVLGNRLENVGSMYDPNWDPVQGKRIGSCVAGIRMVRVVKSLVADNTFIHIKNLPKEQTALGKYGPGHLHAIYLSNYASENMIRGNIFEDTNGSPVRFRNLSESNVITGNRFRSFDYTFYDSSTASYLATHPKVAAVTEWYCNRASSLCVPKPPECRTHAVTITSNVYDGSGYALFHTQASEAGLASQSTCSVNDDSVKIAVTQSNDYDSSQGLCEITAAKDCPSMALNAGDSQIDFRYAGWSQASDKQSVCQQRAQAYYAACTSGSADLIQKTRSVFSVKEQPLRAFEYGKGCFVRGLSCPRMALDNTERADPKDGVNASASACLGRVQAWYNSCSSDEPDRRMWVSSRFFSGSNISESVTGHGCTVTATHCPRMGFFDGETKIDPRDSAHSSLAHCQARARTWWGSCTTDLPAGEVPSVQIQMRFYDHGSELGQAKYP